MSEKTPESKEKKQNFVTWLFLGALAIIGFDHFFKK